MNRQAWLTLLAAVTMSGCAAASAEQQAISEATAALGGRDRIEAVKTLVVSGEGKGYCGGIGQVDRHDLPNLRSDGLQTRHRSHGSTRAARADANPDDAELRRPGAGKAGAGDRRRGGLQRGRQREQESRRERGHDACSPREHLSPPPDDASSGAGSGSQGCERADTGQRNACRHHDGRWRQPDAGHRHDDEAADARGVEVRRREHPR